MGMYVENLDGRNSALTREALLKAGAFQNEAAIGTDYVLSRKLKSRGYRIRSVLASRVQTEYPIHVRAYLRQGSRWYRNRLVQGFRYQHWADVISSFYAGLASLFIFWGPFIFFLKSITVVIIWLITILHFGLSQIRLRNFYHLLRNPHITEPNGLSAYLIFALLSNLTMVNGLINSLLQKRNKSW
jgi:cellulose synthase/poly-beta-1,6-N-acetylglucosamine synthase-like glycosyltransferase